MTNHRPIIKVHKLKKSFGKGKGETKVLKDVDLDINAGEFVIIYGPSGCGKSTLLNTIAGLEEPNSGWVHVKGHDLYSLNSDQRATFRLETFGVIYQQAQWIKPLKVLENVVFPLDIGGYPYRKSLDRGKKALELFTMEEFSKNRPTELSGGQQQKVSLVRALIANPSIILADEPTGNLDKVSAGDLMYVLQSLNEEFKRTIIMVTHNPAYEKYASKLVYMEDGDITDIKVNKKVSMDPNETLVDVIMEDHS